LFVNRGNVIDLGIGKLRFTTQPSSSPPHFSKAKLTALFLRLFNLLAFLTPLSFFFLYYIGVVIGGAFSDIIDSFVIDILTPPLSLWATGTNLEHSFIVLRHGRTPGKKYATYIEAQEDGAV